MNRRQFLEVIALSLISSKSHATKVSTENILKKLNNAWKLDGNSNIEIWLSDLNLSLNETLQAIEDWVIPSTSRVILRLEDGIHTFKESVNFQHPYGKKISIIGNIINPKLCRFRWSNSNDAIYVNAGSVLGLIDGITLEHTDIKNRGLGSALLADNGGIIFCGSNIKVYNFYYGFQARFGGVIQCEGTSSYGAGDANYFAFNGGFISAPRANAYNARDDANGLGSGFVAEYGGAINAIGALASKNAFSGFTALSNGSIRADKSRATFNGKAGYYVNTGGVIVAHNGIATSNCGKGIWRRHDNEAFEGNHFTDSNNLKDSKLCMEETKHD